VTRLPCLALCLAVVFITASAQTNLSHDHAELISHVKNAPASRWQTRYNLELISPDATAR